MHPTERDDERGDERTDETKVLYLELLSSVRAACRLAPEGVSAPRRPATYDAIRRRVADEVERSGVIGSFGAETRFLLREGSLAVLAAKELDSLDARERWLERLRLAPASVAAAAAIMLALGVAAGDSAVTRSLLAAVGVAVTLALVAMFHRARAQCERGEALWRHLARSIDEDQEVFRR